MPAQHGREQLVETLPRHRQLAGQRGARAQVPAESPHQGHTSVCGTNRRHAALGSLEQEAAQGWSGSLGGKERASSAAKGNDEFVHLIQHHPREKRAGDSALSEYNRMSHQGPHAL